MQDAQLAYIFFSMIQDGFSALHTASGNGHDDIVQLLLDGGARIDLPSKV